MIVHFFSSNKYTVLVFLTKLKTKLFSLRSIVRSPIYSHFAETLSGAPSILAYDCAPRFVAESEGKVDSFARVYYYCIIVNRWLGTR